MSTVLAAVTRLHPGVLAHAGPDHEPGIWTVIVGFSRVWLPLLLVSCLAVGGLMGEVGVLGAVRTRGPLVVRRGDSTFRLQETSPPRLSLIEAETFASRAIYGRHLRARHGSPVRGAAGVAWRGSRPCPNYGTAPTSLT